MQSRDLSARITGLTVFAIGIAILVISFIIAYRLFTSPADALAISSPQPGTQPATTALSRSAIVILYQIGLLFIMVLVGSLIAGRGVQMYSAGECPQKAIE
ncbi:MAG: hypothetical protein ABFD64_11105 [Armatimonadota bacterium]